MNSQMTLGLLVVGSVGDNPPKNFNAWTLDLPSLKDLRGLGVIFHDPLGGIHLPNTSQKILKNHYFGDTPYSSEFSGVFLMAIQQKNLKTVFSYNLHSMGILELLVEFLLYISWTWKILKHKTSWKYPLQTTLAWPSHSWFTDMYGGHPANWKSKCLRASIWQCVMFPQLLRQRSMYILLLYTSCNAVTMIVMFGGLRVPFHTKHLQIKTKILDNSGLGRLMHPIYTPQEEFLKHGSVIPKSVAIKYHRNHRIPLNSTLKYQNISGQTILKQLATLKCCKISM